MAEGETESPELEQSLSLARSVLAAYGDAVTDGETDPLLELLHPDADLEIPSAIHRDVIATHGHAEVRRYLEEIAADYTELRAEPREFRPLSNGRLLVLGYWQGQVRGGTTHFGTPFAVIVEVRGDKVARLRAFFDEQQALDAAGGG
jgi:ketosteroid isomerase-like protein